MNPPETKLRDFEMVLRGESARLELARSVYSPESLNASALAFGELLAVYQEESRSPVTISLIFDLAPNLGTRSEVGALIGSFLNYLLEEELQERMRSHQA